MSATLLGNFVKIVKDEDTFRSAKLFFRAFELSKAYLPKALPEWEEASSEERFGAFKSTISYFKKTLKLDLFTLMAATLCL